MATRGSQKRNPAREHRTRKGAKPRSPARGPTQANLFTALPPGSPERTRLKASLAPRTIHGGDAAKGKRKTARPFTAKAPLHLVLKSTRAKGEWSLAHRKHKAKVTSMIYVYARRFHVHVYRATNVGNHLHLLAKATDRKNLADFLRVLAGRVAVTVTGARKGVKRVGKFWDSLTWSRLVSWGRDFFHVREYLAQEFQLAGIRVNGADARPGDFSRLYPEIEPGAPPG